MPSLHEFQLRCRQAFFAREGAALTGLTLSRDELPAVGISVYRNKARETFRLALAASYPISEQLVGADCFAALAIKYQAAHPSAEPDLQTFGKDFPAFLERCYAETPHRYLADVARLELATEQVLLKPEKDPLDAGQLAQLPVQTLSQTRLKVCVAARLVESCFPLLAIWRMHRQEDSPRVSLNAGPCHLLVLRSNGNALLRELSPLEFKLADLLSGGEAIGDAFESLIAGSSVVALQEALAGLLSYRIFTGIY